MKKYLLCIFCLSFLWQNPTQAQPSFNELTIEFKLPNMGPHRPYVAVWIETPSGQAVKTIAVWHERKKWLKDIRRWWRKVGRSSSDDLDAVTGATRGVGSYKLTWKGDNDSGQKVQGTQFNLYLESVREEGGRDLVKIPLNLKQLPIEITRPAKREIGRIKVSSH